MADETQDTQIEESAPEETSEHEGQEVVQSAEMLEFIQSRRQELGLEGQEEPGEPEAQVQEGDETPAKEAAPEDGPEEETPPESASRTARRALQKEKKLRAEREAFAAEQDKWKSETEESRSKVEAFERTRDAALTDPVSHLTQIGLSEEDLMNVAREIYYKHMPEAATPAVQAEMAAIQRERRLKKLEAQQAAKDEPDEQPEQPTGPTPEYQAYEAEYKQGLTAFAEDVDPEEFPLAAEYADKDFDDLVAGMFTAAVQNPNKNQRDLTPQECMAAVERYLEKMQPPAQAQPEPTTQTEEPAPQTRKATLRNKTTAAMPNEKHEDDLTYDELREKARANFEAKMRERQMIR